MTPDLITSVVARIREMYAEPATTSAKIAATELADWIVTLYSEVLEDIANGEPNPAACARAALEVEKLLEPRATASKPTARRCAKAG